MNNIYGELSSVIQKVKGSAYDCHVLRSEAGNIFIVSEGTLLKWETALRKGLEIIANEPNLTIEGKVPSLCLKLSLAGQSPTDADKKLIRTALAAAGVKATFCDQ